MDQWNVWQIQFNAFSTESAPYSMWRGLTIVVGGGTLDNTILDADAIAKLLLLIFYDQEAAV
jgi:hypothetical protein